MSDPSRLVLVMGDQLSLNLSSLQAANPARDRVLMVEVMEETTYVPHHQKKSSSRTPSTSPVRSAQMHLLHVCMVRARCQLRRARVVGRCLGKML